MYGNHGHMKLIERWPEYISEHFQDDRVETRTSETLWEIKPPIIQLQSEFTRSSPKNEVAR